MIKKYTRPELPMFCMASDIYDMDRPVKKKPAHKVASKEMPAKEAAVTKKRSRAEG